MIKAFIFDFNDTLIHSPAWMDLEIRTLPQTALALLAEQGHIPVLDETQFAQAETVFHNARETANQAERETTHIDDLLEIVAALDLQTQVPPPLVEETVEALHRRCIPQVTLIEGVENTLQQLKSQGYRLSIISNAAFSPFLTWTLTHFGVKDYFEDILVSADVGVRKPNPEIFKIALDRMGLAPHEVVYIGDDFEKDVVGSIQFGMQAIWFHPAGDGPPPNSQVTPSATVTELIQIIDWGERWRANA